MFPNDHPGQQAHYGQQVHPLSTDFLKPSYLADFRRKPPRSCGGGASHPAMVEVADEKLARFHPELFGFSGWWIHFVGISMSRQNIAEWTYHGDSRAAMVVNLSPLIVSAYTDELDCVAILRFPDELTHQYKLRAGTRLLTANTYQPPAPWAQKLQSDLWHGPDSHRNHIGFHPIIVDFISEDTERIAQRKSEIDSDEWNRCQRMAEWRMRQVGSVARDGRPRWSGAPAKRL